MIFRKWGGGVKGRLELFRKFIRFGTDRLPLDTNPINVGATLIMFSHHIFLVSLFCNFFEATIRLMWSDILCFLREKWMFTKTAPRPVLLFQISIFHVHIRRVTFFTSRHINTFSTFSPPSSILHLAGKIRNAITGENIDTAVDHSKMVTKNVMTTKTRRWFL